MIKKCTITLMNGSKEKSYNSSGTVTISNSIQKYSLIYNKLKSNSPHSLDIISSARKNRKKFLSSRINDSNLIHATLHKGESSAVYENKESSAIKILGEDTVREFKGLADMSCISFKHVDSLMSSLESQLNEQKIVYMKEGSYMVKCYTESVEFDMEVMKLDKFSYIRFNKLSGEGKEYRELVHRHTLEAMEFPGGETREGFCARVLSAFRQIVREAAGEGFEQIAIVTHGGAIMSVMERLCTRRRYFHDWWCDNGSGYQLRLLDDGRVECLDRLGEKSEELVSN